MSVRRASFLGLLLALPLLAGPAAAQSVPATPGPTAPIGPISPAPRPHPTLGGGGSYKGPGDVVPPNILPPFDPNVDCGSFDATACDPALLPSGSCGNHCSALSFSPAAGSQCVHCLGSADPESCFLGQGWDLTFGALRTFCDGDPGCADAAGNVTVCMEGVNACEVHVFESDWINHELFEDRPVCAPVAGQVCIDGVPQWAPPHAFEEHHQGGLACGYPWVCITFHRDCLCAAIDAWEQALAGMADTFNGKWIYHVGFTTCQGCDCPGAPPPPDL